MGATKREVADKLGVAKQTVVNYIDRLDLADHVSRVGKTDVIDDYAVSALADALGKTISPAKREKAIDDNRDSVVESLKARINDLKDENQRLAKDIEDRKKELTQVRDAHARDIDRLHIQLADANARADKLADRLADIAERQQAIAAAHWWQRGRMLTNLLGPGKGND